MDKFKLIEDKIDILQKSIHQYIEQNNNLRKENEKLKLLINIYKGESLVNRKLREKCEFYEKQKRKVAQKLDDIISEIRRYIR